MIQDVTAIQIECETADDIVIRRHDNRGMVNEYVQVKATEKDKKWTISELISRDQGRKRSSVCEKSLLCDKHGDIAIFRIVTTRDVTKALAAFTRARSKRSADPAFLKLVASFSKKYKDKISHSGRSLENWSKELLWEVEADEKALKARNINTLLRLAHGRGANPALLLVEEVYERLMQKTRAMGDASTKELDEKAWTRNDALSWWESQIELIRAAGATTVKVYQTASVPAFFSELCNVNDKSIRRALYAYDVEYDGHTWRKNELIEHLIDLFPEIALPPHTLASFNHLSARRLPSEALKALDQRGSGVDMSKVIASLILHAILRHHFDAEPIACRIFYYAKGELRSTSAHILQLSSGDEIWLGRSRLVTASSHQTIIDEVLAEMRTALSREVLREERDIIIQLREPRHLRVDSLDGILDSTGKMSALLELIRLPILVAYDSAALQGGFDEAYVNALRQETQDEYERFKTQIGDELSDVEIYLFLVPVECAATIAQDFETKLRRL